MGTTKQVKQEKQCHNCDNTGWVWIPYNEAKRGPSGEMVFGYYKRCRCGIKVTS